MNKTDIIQQCELPYKLRRSIATMKLWDFQTQPNKLSKKAVEELQSQGWEQLASDIPQGRKTVSIWRKRA